MKTVKVVSYNLEPRIISGLEYGLTDVAALVAAEAKSLCPVAPKDGGRLRNSLHYKTGSTVGLLDAGEPVREIPKALQVLVGSAVNYAVYQEYGTRKMAPQPYIRPAIAIKAFGQNPAAVLQKRQRERMKGRLTGGERVRFF
jgi:HK97 gp10 family phage protein